MFRSLNIQLYHEHVFNFTINKILILSLTFNPTIRNLSLSFVPWLRKFFYAFLSLFPLCVIAAYYTKSHFCHKSLAIQLPLVY